MVSAAIWFVNTAVNTIVKAKGVEGTGGTSLDATSGQVQAGED